jgi:hypothetical protein
MSQGYFHGSFERSKPLPAPPLAYHAVFCSLPVPKTSFTHVGKSEFSLITFIQSNASLHSLSRQCHRCHSFLYFGQHIEIFW